MHLKYTMKWKLCQGFLLSLKIPLKLRIFYTSWHFFKILLLLMYQDKKDAPFGAFFYAPFGAFLSPLAFASGICPRLSLGALRCPRSVGASGLGRCRVRAAPLSSFRSAPVAARPRWWSLRSNSERGAYAPLAVAHPFDVIASASAYIIVTASLLWFSSSLTFVILP